MQSIDKLSESIEKYISSIDFPARPDQLYSPIRYSLESGGKRLRPLLVLLGCNMFCEDTDRALPCAGAVEMFHNFTLLHDDIMDNAEVRRGRSSVHKKWNRNIAILSGDAMVISSYTLLQKAPEEHMNGLFRVFNQMAMEVCEGQQYDIDFESRDDVTIEEYLEMIRLKTAVMIAGSITMGAITGGAGEQICKQLYDFGIQVGIAYQLQDDYLDTYGTPEILGKNIGGDIAESKKTFLMINALNQAPDATRRALISTLHDNSLPLAQKTGRVKTIYNSLDIPEITREVIREHLSAATAILDDIAVPQEKKTNLRKLIDKLHDRNK